MSLVTAADRGLAAAEVVMLVQTLAVFLYVATSLRERAQVLFANQRSVRDHRHPGGGEIPLPGQNLGHDGRFVPSRR